MVARASAGTTFARVPPRITPTVRVTPLRGILQIVDGDDLPRQLAHRADALPRIETGVRRHPARDHLELTDAFAAGLERAAGQRRLEHQHRLALRRFRFDQRARGRAADFLVGGPQHHDPAVVEAPRSITARVASDARPMPAFMSNTPGPYSRPPSRFNGICCELADRPHGIEVAEQQDLPRAAAETGAQVIAGGAGRNAGHRSANRLEPRRQLAATPVHRGRIVARRLNRDQRLDELEQPVVIREAIVEEGHEVLRGLELERRRPIIVL